MLESRVTITVKKAKVGGRMYEHAYITIPKKVFNDSQFPFKPGQELIMKVDPENRRIVIEEVRE